MAAARKKPLSFPDALRARLADLEDRVEAKLETYPRASEAVLKRAEKALGETLPPALRALYQATNGLSLVVSQKNGPMSGRVRLVSVEQMLGGDRPWNDEAFEDVLWQGDFEDDFSKAEMRRFRRLRPLDWRDEASPTPTCLDFSRPGKPRLCRLARWKVEELHATVDEYLQALLDTLGFDGWLEPLRNPKSANAKAFVTHLAAALAPKANAPTPAKPSSETVGNERVVCVYLKSGKELEWPGIEFSMVNPRGTVLTRDGKRVAIELDVGVRGWVATRRTKPIAKDDIVERLRKSPGLWDQMLALPAGKLTSALAPLFHKEDAAFRRSGRFRVWAAGSPIFALLRHVPVPQATAWLVQLAKRTSEVSAEEARLRYNERQKQLLPRARLAAAALGALRLRILYEVAQHGEKPLSTWWSSARCKELSALCKEVAYGHALAIGTSPNLKEDGPYAELLALLKEKKPARCDDLFFGDARFEPPVKKARARISPETWMDFEKQML